MAVNHSLCQGPSGIPGSLLKALSDLWAVGDTHWLCHYCSCVCSFHLALGLELWVRSILGLFDTPWVLALLGAFVSMAYGPCWQPLLFLNPFISAALHTWC